MKSDFQRKVYSVSQIAVEIRDMIERKFLDIWVEGEISNFKSSTAGHLYFTLKDSKAQLPAVCFRNAARLLRFRPENGKTFRARGRITTYEARGEYQLIVEVLEPVGLGALQLAFDQLKEKLWFSRMPANGSMQHRLRLGPGRRRGRLAAYADQ